MGEGRARASDEGLPVGWFKGIDPTYNRPYYFNKKTRRSTWTKPGAKALLDSADVGDSGDAEVVAAPVPDPSPDHEKSRNSSEKKAEEGKTTELNKKEWLEVYSPEHKRWYYFNRRTKESRWTKPKNGEDALSSRKSGPFHKLKKPDDLAPSPPAAMQVPALNNAWNEIEEARKQLQREREEHMQKIKAEYKALQTQIQGLRELAIQSNVNPSGLPRKVAVTPDPTAAVVVGTEKDTPEKIVSNGGGEGGFVMEGEPNHDESKSNGSAFDEATPSANVAAGDDEEPSYTAGLLTELEEYADSLMKRRESIHRLTGRARNGSVGSDFDKDAYIAEVLESLGVDEHESSNFKSKFAGNSKDLIPFFDELREQVEASFEAVQKEAKAVEEAHKQHAEMEEGGFYKLLEVSPDASAADLKKGYYKMMMKYHPDKFQGSEEEREDAAKKSTQIGQAYQALFDPWERRLYDKMGVQQYLIHANVVQCFINYLVTGIWVKKHPHSRKKYGWKIIDRQFVLRRFFWLSTDHQHLNIAKKRNLEPSEEELEKIKRIPIADIKGIKKGISTDVLAATGKLSKENKYLSIVSDERTLDLELPDQKQREFLASRLELLVISLQKDEQWFDRFHERRKPRSRKKKRGKPPNMRRSSSSENKYRY